MSTKSLTTNMLAFERSFQITEAVMWAQGPDGDRSPIEVSEKGVRGQSSEGNAKNEGKSNPQVVDMACIPPEHEAMVISFTVRVMPRSMKAQGTDNAAVAAAYGELASMYRENGGYRFLATRYLANIMNGRFAWRNRYQSDNAVVSITFEDRLIDINPFAFDLSEMPTVEEMRTAIIAGEEHFDDLIDHLESGLTDEPFEFSVEWHAEMPEGAEVWPSQEYVRAQKEEGASSRVYAVLPYRDTTGRLVRQASIHSQKIGAAIRHIDDFHGDPNYGPIAANPYGGVQETSAVLRATRGGSALSFYAIMDDATRLFDEVSKDAQDMDNDVHFFFANLIRGGVFGKKDKSATKKGAE